MALKPLGDFLDRAIARTGAKRSIDATLIVEATRPIITQMLPELRPADFEVVSYHKCMLTIATANPAIAQELRMRSDVLLEVLNDTFPDHAIKRLRFVPLVIPDDGF